MQGWQRHPWKYLWGVQFWFDNQNPDLIFGDRKLLINLTLQLKESGGCLKLCNVTNLTTNHPVVQKQQTTIVSFQVWKEHPTGIKTSTCRGLCCFFVHPPKKQSKSVGLIFSYPWFTPLNQRRSGSWLSKSNKSFWTYWSWAKAFIIRANLTPFPTPVGIHFSGFSMV